MAAVTSLELLASRLNLPTTTTETMFKTRPLVQATGTPRNFYCGLQFRSPFLFNGCRRYSVPAVKGSLPLEGYRVLDMTRVLAGVSTFGFQKKARTDLASHTVLNSLAILGKQLNLCNGNLIGH